MKNPNKPLISDTTQRVKIYEASKILKRCNCLDYFIDDNEDNAVITISNQNGILCTVSVYDDMDDF